MTTTKKKKFDCMEVKRKSQMKIYEEIKEMTPEQEIDYFRRSVNKSELAKWWKSAKSHFELIETLRM